ncbi:MAG TPA: glutamine--fructose-6-phosphate aminotransferase, partial [Clostridiales bacterium]|nr:glutamine--fructose-6-phosphate aminotransferase [Clostridiales bacterium]
MASLCDGSFNVVKRKGRVASIEKDSENILGNIGIGHTRWSTHGKPSDENSHPHYTKNFAVVHNGIIENYLDLKIELVNDGVKFSSETDTEVIVHLLEKYYQGDFLSAVKKTLKRLCGSYALAIICKDYPEEIIVAKKDNPLIIGLGDKEGFVASDIPALADYTNKIIYLQDGEFAEVKRDEAIVYNDKGIKTDREITVVDVEKSQLSTAGYESFMLKEINEIPFAIENTRKSLQNLILPEKLVYMLKNTDLIKIIGCGTAYNSGLVGKQLFTKYARVRCETDIASEFRYNENLIDDKTLVIAV